MLAGQAAPCAPAQPWPSCRSTRPRRWNSCTRVSADPGVLQELRTATDLALRATKVTARALGQTMSTLVVQERHLWLTLADMRESDKHRFLDSPISQAGLFGEAVEDFAQQFSAAQKQTEAFRHILPRRSAAVSSPTAGCTAPPPARRRRRPPAASTSASSSATNSSPSQWPKHGAGPQESGGGPASSPPAKPVTWPRVGVRPWRRATRSLGILLFRRWAIAPLLPPEEGRGRIFVLFRTGPSFNCVRPFDWVAAIDLKDAYFHVSILPRFRFAYKGASIPVGPPLRGTSAGWGFRSTGKRATLPYAEDLFSRQGVGLGQPHSASLRGACSVNAEMPGVSPAQEGRFYWKHFQRLLGHMASSAAITPLGLLHMRPLQRWPSRPSPEMGMATTAHTGSHSPRPAVAPSAHGRILLSSGRSSPRASIQARCCFNRRLCHGLGGPCATGTQPRGSGQGPSCSGISIASSCWQYGLLCTASERCYNREAYTGPLGQHCDRCVHQPPRRSTLPSHVATRPPSPPLESEASEVASRRSCPRRAQSCSRRALTSARPSGRMATPPRGTPADLETLRGRSGRPVCLPGHVSLPVVFLPVRGDPRYRCTGMQLASGLTQICVSPSEPSRTDPVQGQGGRGASPLGCALLAQSDVVPRTDAPRDSPSLANSSEEGSTFSERGHPLAPAPRLVESPRMVLGRDAEVLSGLPPAVVNTITSARALSTRQAYRLKWNLFVDWCSPRREDPRRCPIAVVLSFLQDGLERRLSPSTLKVYVAAIAAHHDAVDGKSLGKHDLVIRFLRGARRLNPPRPHLVPSWDLPSVLSALRGAPFEPLQSVELKFLSLKTVLLSALATVKRVGDLQAFSVDDSCLEFGPADSHVVLRPRPGCVPKVPTMPFRDQVVNLQALPWEEADPAIALLCPVCALRIYVDRTQSFRTSDQLFVCFGGQQKGRAVSKQRLAHWIVEAIVLAYQARRLPCPLGVRAHSTRGVASSWALARGASIADICKAAGWATPNTFARFYNLRIEPVSSRVLVSDGQ